MVTSPACGVQNCYRCRKVGHLKIEEFSAEQLCSSRGANLQKRQRLCNECQRAHLCWVVTVNRRHLGTSVRPCRALDPRRTRSAMQSVRHSRHTDTAFIVTSYMFKCHSRHILRNLWLATTSCLHLGFHHLATPNSVERSALCQRHTRVGCIWIRRDPRLATRWATSPARCVPAPCRRPEPARELKTPRICCKRLSMQVIEAKQMSQDTNCRPPTRGIFCSYFLFSFLSATDRVV